MNTYDWINTLELSDPTEFHLVEVSFKNGANKEFYINEYPGQYATGDIILVEAATGYDVGQISLMGELVRMQIKKKSIPLERITTKIIRKANERDLEKLAELRKSENPSLVRARAIAYSMGLDMKVSDVQYQGDGRKATFFYTAHGRVDFRELVKEFAKEFKVKIEMRQIGSRQESSRIGGIGSCGRELCCSTWLTDFRSVNTSAARYQNISINQTKLSGQCGRLKCCLNYELDSYMDALQHFPTRADMIFTKKGKALLVKTDIFKGIMYYSYEDITMRGVFHPLPKDRVKEILAMNAKGIKPEDLSEFGIPAKVLENEELKYADVTGQIELPSGNKKKKNNSRNRQNPNQNGGRPNTNPQNKPHFEGKKPSQLNEKGPSQEFNPRPKPSPNNPNQQNRNNPERVESKVNGDNKPDNTTPPQAGENTNPTNKKKKFNKFRNRNKDNKSNNE
jgi:cell fate regulator YaaT (PSP1 superfamily)